MISDRYECIFIHVPRCGGTSVEEVIWPHRRTEDDLWMGFVDRYHNKHQTGGLQHLLASQIRKEVGETRFSSYFKFAFVRNPFDRLVSQFAYMSHRSDLRAFVEMPQGASFETYLDSIDRKRHVQWEQQRSFLYDESGALLIDFVGRFERLADDAKAVLQRLGIDDVDLPHLNRTDRPPYRDLYSPHSKARVEEMYREDLIRFGYEF